MKGLQISTSIVVTSSIIVGLGIGSFIALGVVRLVPSSPPLQPMIANDPHAELMLDPVIADDAGEHAEHGWFWRVSFSITVNEICQTRLVRRAFRSAATQTDELIAPDFTSAGVSKGPITESRLPLGLAPERHVWYRARPGIKGAYIVSIASAGCPSKYTGVDTLYVVPFDWTALH